MKKNTVIALFICLSLLVSCQNNENKEIEEEKNELLSQFNDEEKDILDKITSHQDQGFYTYITTNLESGETIQKISHGIDTDKNILIDVEEEKIYALRNKDTFTIFDTDKNIYYQDKKSQTNDISKITEEDQLRKYNELIIKGGFKIVKDKDNIKLSFEDGSYDIYDSKNFDLLESVFKAEGNKLIQKLDSKDTDVEKYYQDYIKMIETMKRVDNRNEVTGKI
ncbi:MAG: hypothetical protein PUG67_08900 [Peptoniphilaceae bacterium]|nr:hypothetical protein [Peptoniphilaceae bacterium]MDY6018336.1 hypothetical protein [Anaerococcus sp.]